MNDSRGSSDEGTVDERSYREGLAGAGGRHGGRTGGIREGTLAGWRTVVLTSDRLEVTVLVDKGADIYSIVDRTSGIDALFKAPWGLPRPGSAPREGSEGAEFLKWYEGGWQELFPNTNDACVDGGVELPFHGEVATLPWSWWIEKQELGEIAVGFTVDCALTPFRLTRLMRLRDGEGRLLLQETVSNKSRHSGRFAWGHHCVVGAPIVAAGAELLVPCRTVMTPPELWEDTARLQPGQRAHWPVADLRAGGQVDLSRIPGPEAASHDDVYLTGFDAGWAEVRNPALGLGFRLDWDPAVFPWLISWQPFGGARQMPLRGSYGLGLEPWTSGGNLTTAVTNGEAHELAGGASLSTTVAAGFTRW